MSILTTFFHLIKPGKTDGVKVSDFNANMDIIDTEMHKPPLTVNSFAPDPTTRNLVIEEVPLADNLTSDVAQLVPGTFIERMTGGSAPIQDGTAFLSTIKGNQTHTGYVAESINMTVNAVPRVAPPAITAILDKDTFETYVEGQYGTYTLTYTTAWSANPALYGVTVSNTPINGDEIVIVWEEPEEGEDPTDPVMTVNAATRPVPAAITATIDRDTFVAYVASSGTITLNYTTAWSANPELYGITVTNTPVAGDSIVVVYVKEDRGTITTSNPVTFNSTGWNLYDNSVGYARVIKYSAYYGYLIGGNYSLVEFATTVSGTRSSVTVTDGVFNVSEDGYIFVTGGDATTYILATWSDWDEGYEGDFESYDVDTIDLSGAMSVYFPFGLCAIGIYHDEINLNAMKAISRIGRVSYSAENLASIIAMDTPYDADTSYIYFVRASAVTNSISSIDGTYEVSDHGIEYFTGTTVPVITEILYGDNLKDKLRTDVVTISQQTLSSEQKAQVRTNIGAAGEAELSPLNGAIAKLKSDLGIVEDGDTATHAISEGQYVIWKGDLYIASSAISIGVTLSASNLTACSNGGLNVLSEKKEYTISKVSNKVSNFSINCYQFGKIVYVYGSFTLSTQSDWYEKLLSGFPKPIGNSATFTLVTRTPNSSGERGVDAISLMYDNGVTYLNSHERVLPTKMFQFCQMYVTEE